MRRTFFCLLLSVWGIASADVNGDLQHFFDNLGFESNTTAPHAYAGQQAGYYTGGSLFARNAVRSAQLAYIDLPSFRSGCGGIDAYLGGFSFINSQQFIQMGKSILSNASGYAFMLAEESLSPEAANVLKYIQDMANKVNGLNINSCEASEKLVGGMWSKIRSSQQQVCEDYANNQGGVGDWSSAREACTDEGKFKEQMNKASADDKYKSLVIRNTNLAWKALKLNTSLASDVQLMELMMSLTGTLIVGEVGSNNGVKVLPSLATDDSLVKAMLYGGKARMYHCDETSLCLNPRASDASVMISASNALKGQVDGLLNSIVQKIRTNQALDAKEIGLLQSTSLPIYKLLNVQVAALKDKAIIDYNSYSQLIAVDLLFQYLHESLNLVEASARTQQLPPDLATQFQTQISTAIDRVNHLELMGIQRLQATNALISQSQALEQTLAGQLSQSLANNLAWAGGL